MLSPFSNTFTGVNSAFGLNEDLLPSSTHVQFPYRFAAAFGTLMLKPNLLFVNCSTPTIEQDIAISKQIRNDVGKIIFFGTHALALPNQLLTEAKGVIDACMIGDTEETARRVCESYLKKKDISKVEGVVSIQDGVIYNNERGHPTDISTLNPPARHLINNELYTLPNGELFTSVLVSRGCPYNCSFCNAPFYHGMKVRKRSPEQVVEEIENVVKEYNIRWFLLASDLFTIDKKWVYSFCKLLKEKVIKVNWMCNSRIDTIDYDLLKTMKSAGCWMITFGIESGSQRMLDSIGKHYSIEQIRRVIEDCSKLNIMSHGSFIFGLPGESRESIKDTISLTKSIPLDLAFFYLATPYPGTKLYETTKNNINNKEWKKFNFNEYVIDSDISPEELIAYQKRAIKEFYLRPSYALRQLKRNLKNPVLMLKYLVFVTKKLIEKGIIKYAPKK